MKKLSWVLTILLCLCYMTSCKKEATKIQKTETIAEFLSKDSSFENIIELEIELNDILKNIIIEKNISQLTLSSKMDSIYKTSGSEIYLKEKLGQTINPFVYDQLVSFKKRYAQNWKQIELRFSSISSTDITSACSKYYDRLTLNNINIISKKSFALNSNTISRTCGWGYNLCLAGATAAAILCHTSCIGGTAGFGAPVCVFLCGTIQIAVGAECYKSNCEL
jgi:hypothetical protein